jgi:hypothetical protein
MRQQCAEVRARRPPTSCTSSAVASSPDFVCGRSYLVVFEFVDIGCFVAAEEAKTHHVQVVCSYHGNGCIRGKQQFYDDDGTASGINQRT